MERRLFKRGRRIVCYMNVYDNKIAVHLGKPSDSNGFVWMYDKDELDAAMRTVDDLMNFRLSGIGEAF